MLENPLSQELNRMRLTTSAVDNAIPSSFGCLGWPFKTLKYCASNPALIFHGGAVSLLDTALRIVKSSFMPDCCCNKLSGA